MTLEEAWDEYQIAYDEEIAAHETYLHLCDKLDRDMSDIVREFNNQRAVSFSGYLRKHEHHMTASHTLMNAMIERISTNG